MVELLVVLTLIIGLSAIGFRVFQSAGFSQKSMSRQALLQMEARRAFDKVVEEIREGSDLVRPFTGETLPFLVFKDIINRTVVVYLEPNIQVSERLKKRVFKLMAYRSDYSGAYDPKSEMTLLETVRRITFTSLSPNGVQVNLTVLNENDEFGFLAHVGLMNIGGLE